MKDFLKKVIEGMGGTPTPMMLEAFHQKFENAVNVDWYDRGDFFETIFYKDNLEHIAIFSVDGRLMEYKLYLPDSYLPEPLKTVVEKKGEIMNTVLRNKGNKLEYEVIYRDKDLNRYLLTLSDIGSLVEEKKL